MLSRTKFDAFFPSLHMNGERLKAADGATKKQMLYVVAAYVNHMAGEPISNHDDAWDDYCSRMQATIKDLESHFGHIKHLHEEVKKVERLYKEYPKMKNELDFRYTAAERRHALEEAYKMTN